MRRSASEIINDLESRIARLEKRATAYSQDIPISRKQLKDAKRDITDEFGEGKYDGNYGYVGKEDLNLGSWVRLYSSKTKEGLSIFYCLLLAVFSLIKPTTLYLRSIDPIATERWVYTILKVMLIQDFVLSISKL